ncbi:Major facilitator superfamily MFS_1 [uncultured spirochete]|jgi:MFS family permease|uniref:Major facilitator superfamily MFS_1 n=1 Tax=uncultured spirochete TaxID=156406 RepID=A0A3P3XL06_9SPIR|nr:MFS transporter [Rectinema subterraneum]SLM15149.1 Major facilitator superfamily MFS_1 [uncultured spirochete]HBE46185.1 MFS transporter [Spirochaetaceae bacterium]
MDRKKGFGPYLGITFLIGFGFFTMGLMDPLYDTYVPIFLSKYIGSMSLVGFIMTIDNILAIFLIPIVSAWSDRTNTRIGRRMPYILVLLPLTAIFFGAIPYAAGASLAALIAILLLLNVTKQSVRGPVVALMPDTIPADYRSEANGVINTMGGIASIVGTIGLARLMDLDTKLPLLGNTKDRLPFPLAGLFVVLAIILLFAFIREKKPDQTETSEQKIPMIESFRNVAAQKDKSALYILISLFLWFLGYQGVLPFIGKYSVDVLKTSSGTAALAAGMVGIAYAIFALPSGYVAHRVGRKKTIRASLLVISILTAILFAHPWLTAAMPGSLKLASFWAIMFLFGIFWVSIITNSFPMLWQMAEWGTIGIYTGLYYTASQAAAILAPILTGLIIDVFGYSGIFLFCTVCMLAARFVMGKVTKGEPAESPAEA